MSGPVTVEEVGSNHKEFTKGKSGKRNETLTDKWPVKSSDK